MHAAPTSEQLTQHPGQQTARTRRLCWCLATAVSTGGALTLLAPGALHGTAAMNGSARGTALAMIAFGVPTLLVATALSSNSTNTVTTARALATYLMLLVLTTMVIWLRAVVPALSHTDAPEFLADTGMITNPIYVQDLSFWLPLGGLSAIWLWHQRPWGVVLSGAFLSMSVLESLSVALDQEFGSQADPQSFVVSSSMVVPFLLFAAASVAALAVLLSRLGRGDAPGATGRAAA